MQRFAAACALGMIVAWTAGCGASPDTNTSRAVTEPAEGDADIRQGKHVWDEAAWKDYDGSFAKPTHERIAICTELSTLAFTVEDLLSNHGITSHITVQNGSLYSLYVPAKEKRRAVALIIKDSVQKRYWIIGGKN